MVMEGERVKRRSTTFVVRVSDVGLCGLVAAVSHSPLSRSLFLKRVGWHIIITFSLFLSMRRSKVYCMCVSVSVCVCTYI